MSTAAAATNGATLKEQGSLWHRPESGSGAASQYDFRSDVMTTPTASMLRAIELTSLADDVFEEDPTTNALEAYMAQLTGKEAALLVMSGTMGNQVALRTHLTAPPHSMVCDARSHIVRYEAGGASLLSGAMQIAVQPANGHHLTRADVEAHAVVSDDVHACPTRLVCLENTLNGMVTPQADVEAIAAFARAHGMALHLDGARVWEVAAATGRPLAELLAPFDSASLCFSKGLGAPIGSVVVGSRAFVRRARHIRKMLGGGTRQAGVISAPARVAVDETFGQGKLAASHARARAIADLWLAKATKAAAPTLQPKLTYPVETNMVWLDFASVGVAEEDFVRIAAGHGIKTFGSRLVVHYQISDDAVRRLDAALDDVIALALEKQATATATTAINGVSSGKENIYGSSKEN